MYSILSLVTALRANGFNLTGIRRGRATVALSDAVEAAQVVRMIESRMRAGSCALVCVAPEGDGDGCTEELYFGNGTAVARTGSALHSLLATL